MAEKRANIEHIQPWVVREGPASVAPIGICI
jgi:hypothetical protein